MSYDALNPVDGIYIADVPGAIRSKGIDLKAIIDAHVAQSVAAHLASAIANDPEGNIASTTVQAAINELDGDKVAKNDVVTTATANKLLKLDGNAKLPADITGNAGTATKLATHRAINGVSFDGTTPISITKVGTKDIATTDQIPAAPTDYVVAQSLGANGYTRWASGKIEQWGIVIWASTLSVTFPIEFPHALYTPPMLSVFIPGVASPSYAPMITNYNNTGWTGYFQTNYATSVVSWTAVGY